MSAAAPNQADHIMKVRRTCWQSHLYQIGSRWRLLDPDPAVNMFSGQQSMLDRMNSGTTLPKNVG
ncbi:hypothetical protein N7449_005069 [Penicillium cf. viridicatum]|uniref:Uncharacterized protein n=1 Tax=Penicillium cf. viridicatum TaxID=2972119 RepID=A0A9W9MKR6_9EURO|nr:hypothetical protein N7449_005069 [Penicillium cf. viridicatum]